AVTAQHEGLVRATTQLKFVAGAAQTWDPPFSHGGELAGTLLDAQGVAVASAALWAVPSKRGTSQGGNAQTDADGHFEVHGLGLVSQDISVYLPGAKGQITLATAVEVGRTDLVLRLPANADVPSRVVGRVVDPQGAPASGFEVWIVQTGSNESRQAKLED